MDISGVGSLPVQSGSSLIIFQLLRCRDLALNRFFLLFLVAGMFFYIGVFEHPHVCMLPYICMPPYICTPPGV